MCRLLKESEKIMHLMSHNLDGQINSLQSKERPLQTPSSHVIFQVVLSPAAPLIQLNVISVPDSNPSSVSTIGSPFLPKKSSIFHSTLTQFTICSMKFTCRVSYPQLSLACRMLFLRRTYVDSNCHCCLF